MVKVTSPVSLWLKDLSTSVEVEYLNSLQSKSVATTDEAFQAFGIRESQIRIQQIRQQSQGVIDGLDSFIDHLPIIYSDLSLMCTGWAQTSAEVEQIVNLCRKRLYGCAADKNKLLDYVWRGSRHISKLIDFFISNKNVNNCQLESSLRKLKENLGQLVNHFIKNESKVLIQALERQNSPEGGLAVKWSLMSCCSLAQNDAYICRIFVQFHNLVKPLLSILSHHSFALIESDNKLRQKEQIQAIALRLLTVLCTNDLAVKQIIEECIYNQFLSTIIYSNTSDIVVKEALDLLVQITKNLIGTDNQLIRFAQILVNDFVHCLIKVLKTSKERQTILLGLSALANLSFLDLKSLIESDVLSTMMNLKLEEDILVRDQVLTILANIARQYPLQIVSSGGLVFVINSLQLKSNNLKIKEELSALERIHQKACVAIARLAVNQSVTQIFFRLNVIQRLIEICKEPKQRNYSKTVQIASLAALKRLAKVSGLDANKDILV